MFRQQQTPSTFCSWYKVRMATKVPPVLICTYVCTYINIPGIYIHTRYISCIPGTKYSIYVFTALASKNFIKCVLVSSARSRDKANGETKTIPTSRTDHRSPTVNQRASSRAPQDIIYRYTIYIYILVSYYTYAAWLDPVPSRFLSSACILPGMHVTGNER